MSSLAQKITDIIAAQALRDPAELTEQSSLEQIGLDSLGLVEAIFAIEEAFDITVPFNPNEPQADARFSVQTLGQIIQSVEALVAERA